jgi:hypothetical protein
MIITNNRPISLYSYEYLTNKEQTEIKEQFYCNTESDFEDWQFFKVAGNWYELQEGLPHAEEKLPENWEGIIEMRDGGYIYIKAPKDGFDDYDSKIIVGIEW